MMTSRASQELTIRPNVLHSARGHVSVVLEFYRAGNAISRLQQIFVSLKPHQSSDQITPTAARNVYSIARLSPQMMWLKHFAV